MKPKKIESNLPQKFSPQIDRDVVIVGAGPVGLAIALGLYQRGIENILVLDQTRAFRKVGQTVDLLPNGLKSLQYIHPQACKNIKKTGQKLSNPDRKTQKSPFAPTWTTKNIKGETLRSVALEYDEYYQRYGEGRVSISWYDLQTQLRTILPSDRIQANHRCVDIADEPELQCVRADFISNLGAEANPYSHWSEQPEEIQEDTLSEKISIRAKLLIAADGINSTARRIAYGDRGKPEYTGYAAISSGGEYPIPLALGQQMKDRFVQDSRVVTIVNNQNRAAPNEIPRIIFFAPQPDRLRYLLHAALPLDALANKSGKELVNLAIDVLKEANFPDIILEAIALSSPEQMAQRPYYLHKAEVLGANSLKWSLGRMVLVGDAAHGMPPFMAQGANQGLEDAAAIATLVAKIARTGRWDDPGAIASAFEKYERLRRPFMDYIQRVTLQRSPFSSQQQWQDYSQKVYGRNIEEMMQKLLQ